MINKPHLPKFCINDYFAAKFFFKVLNSLQKRMIASRRQRKKQQLRERGCGVLCSSCRLSVSSSEEAESFSTSDRFPSISSLAHAMVQERLDQMIRERQEAMHRERRRQQSREGRACSSSKFIVMVAMERCSFDPREDFRDSMVEMITANRLEDPKELRNLLNYYVCMNSQEYHSLILEVFHQVCAELFLTSQNRYAYH